MITALMTNKNNPRVMIVAGKVRNTKIGFTKIFNKANTAATISEVVNVFTETPERIQLAPIL
jgi:hypothetical protein